MRFLSMNVEDWVVMFGGCMQSGYDAVSRAAVFQSQLDWVVKTQKNIEIHLKPNECQHSSKLQKETNKDVFFIVEYHP